MNAHENERIATLTLIDEEKIKALKEQPVCEGLEAVVSTYLQEHNHDVLLSPYNGLVEFGKLVCQWQREKMLKEAVEGEVILNGHGLLVNATKWANGYKLKVIIKEAVL